MARRAHKKEAVPLTPEQVEAIGGLVKLALIITPALIVAGFCIWLAFTAALGLLRVWALAATAALPIALAVGWYTRGVLAAERSAGRAEATGEVIRAASGVADLRTTAVAAVRQTAGPYPGGPSPLQALTMPENIFLAPVRGRGDGEIIDV